jgi:hypothetical protein
VPSIWAAGGDLSRLRTLDDGEYIDDFATVEEPLAAAIDREQIGLLLLDALIDHIPGGEGGASIYNPKHVREMLKPIRRVTARMDVAALGLLHPIKGKVSSFRQLMAGSHQFNAVSRSSLLLTKDPDDETQRVLVRGKGNHSAAPRSIEFTIVADAFELNGHGFEMPKVVNLVEGDRTVDDLLRATPDAPVRDELAEQLTDVLTTEPKTLADLARAVGATRRTAASATRSTPSSARSEQNGLTPAGGNRSAETGTKVQGATPNGVCTCAPSGVPPRCRVFDVRVWVEGTDELDVWARVTELQRAASLLAPAGVTSATCSCATASTPATSTRR